MKRRGKYNARKVELFGIRFDSRAEANRYLVLRSLEEQGRIEDLDVHPKYRLLKAFRNADGKLVRGMTYTPDFRYVDAEGHVIVEDVKGGRATQTRAFVDKAKWFQKLNPNVHFRVVEV